MLRRVYQVALALFPIFAEAALSVSPPQLHANHQGVAQTDVRSGASVTTRWSARLAPWHPDEAHAVIRSDDALRSREGLVSPRFFSLRPGDHQTLRVRLPADGYWRLVVEQLSAEDSLLDAASGLGLMFRFSMPIFRSRLEPRHHQLTPLLKIGCELIENHNDLAVRLDAVTGSVSKTTLLPGDRAWYCSDDVLLKKTLGTGQAL